MWRPTQIDRARGARTAAGCRRPTGRRWRARDCARLRPGGSLQRPQETSPSDGDGAHVDYGIVENAIEVGREASDHPTRATSVGRRRWGLIAGSGRGRRSAWLLPASTPRPQRRRCRYRRRRTNLRNCCRVERLSIDAKPTAAGRIELRRRRCPQSARQSAGRRRRRRSPTSSTPPGALPGNFARSFSCSVNVKREDSLRDCGHALKGSSVGERCAL
jgi:hypothetical protein